MTPIIGFAGYSGSGKTTLLEKLIPLLKQQGLRIALVKHSHHNIDPDKPGKDSYRLRHAGCNQTLLATKSRHMLYFEYTDPERDEPALAECLAQLDHDQLDLVLVEGFRDETFPKIEIHRPAYGKPFLYSNDEHIIAFTTDEIVQAQQHCKLPILDLNQPQDIADFILFWLDSSETKQHFCPSCGEARLAFQPPKVFRCNACDFTYFHNAAAAVLAGICYKDEILVATRAREPGKGMLDLPGGFVDPDESLEQALTRELQEELDFTVGDAKYISSYPNTYHYKDIEYKTCDTFFVVTLDEKPVLKARDDVEKVEWIRLQDIELNNFAFNSAKQAIQRLKDQAIT